MNKVLTIITLTIGLSLPAVADVWKWVDATGKTHFVDTRKAILPGPMKTVSAITAIHLVMKTQ